MLQRMPRRETLLVTLDSLVRRLATSILLLPALPGCIDLGGLGGGDGVTLFPPGSFVVRGRTEAPPDGADACPIFRAETGVAYYLFQAPDLDNEIFDAVTTPGAVSRLEVQSRADLEVSCGIGETVEVQRVLELIPAPGSQ